MAVVTVLVGLYAGGPHNGGESHRYVVVERKE